MCDLVKKSEGGGMFLLSRGGVHWQGGPCFSFFERGGPLAWGVHWHGGGGYGGTRFGGWERRSYGRMDGSSFLCGPFWGSPMASGYMVRFFSLEVPIVVT